MASTDLLNTICDELDARLRELRPLVDEYESLLDADAALEPAIDAGTGAQSSPRLAKRPTSRRRHSVPAPKRAQRGAAAVAILAALEHGSHTVSELAVVTAMSGQIINSNLRRLQQAGTIARTKRAGDGKAAYTLTATPA
jgi:predicted Rossmann fold nucleotide-binding protein DprA/Smf involved in DNA uptake